MRFRAPDLQSEFEFKTSRSGGAGGQHVNKVATKVQLFFSVSKSAQLTEEEKQIIISRLASQVTEEGVLQVVSQAGRSQHDNKLEALHKMYKLLNKCFVVPKKRKPSKPTKSSVIKRKKLKQRNSEVKKLRIKPSIEN